jgi:hypothetical protein
VIACAAGVLWLGLAKCSDDIASLRNRILPRELAELGRRASELLMKFSRKFLGIFLGRLFLQFKRFKCSFVIKNHPCQHFPI